MIYWVLETETQQTLRKYLKKKQVERQCLVENIALQE